MATQAQDLSPLVREALRQYESKLKIKLEAESLGRAVAIHVDSGDFAIADSHSAAAKLLLQRHQKDGRIVTLTIGPPTAQDIRLASLAATKT